MVEITECEKNWVRPLANSMIETGFCSEIEGVRGSGGVRRRRSHRHGLRLRKTQIEAFVVHLRILV
jgi:hypothetical protein